MATPVLRKLNLNIGNMIVNRIIVLSPLVFANIAYICAEIYQTKWNKFFINSGVNHLIVGAKEPSNSVMRCSITCSNSSQYKSFYYSSASKECYCNTQVDGTMTSTTVDTGLIYGIRTTPEVLFVFFFIRTKLKTLIIMSSICEFIYDIPLFHYFKAICMPLKTVPAMSFRHKLMERYKMVTAPK